MNKAELQNRAIMIEIRSTTDGQRAHLRRQENRPMDVTRGQGRLGGGPNSHHNPTMTLLSTAQTSIQEETMRTKLAAGILAATFVVPAFADDPPKKGSDADEAFMTGIRKLGVMSGEAYACSSDADKAQVGQGALDLATQVSLHFGLQAAFIYSGSFGYGTAHDFDHKECAQAIGDFKALQAKYLAR
jgi:hypothetical protein